jgi:hypothetical protein
MLSLVGSGAGSDRGRNCPSCGVGPSSVRVRCKPDAGSRLDWLRDRALEHDWVVDLLGCFLVAEQRLSGHLPDFRRPLTRWNRRRLSCRRRSTGSAAVDGIAGDPGGLRGGSGASDELGGAVRGGADADRHAASPGGWAAGVSARQARTGQLVLDCRVGGGRQSAHSRRRLSARDVTRSARGGWRSKRSAGVRNGEGSFTVLTSRLSHSFAHPNLTPTAADRRRRGPGRE